MTNNKTECLADSAFKNIQYEWLLTHSLLPALGKCGLARCLYSTYLKKMIIILFYLSFIVNQSSKSSYTNG